MTAIDNVPLTPEPPLRQPPPNNPRGRVWPRTIVLAGVLACGLAAGAGGFAIAAGAMDHMGWGRGMHLAFIQGAAQHALDSVGASAAQEAKVHDIIAAKFAEIAPNPADHEALRKQALDILAAPTVDHAAAEKLRADVVARFDAKSKAIVAGALDIADQLTPTQRTALVAEISEMAQHGPMGMGPWGGHRHPMMNDGADGAPDNSPDKD